ncbi:hypothetical protein B0H34DRAFT_842015 [Crassisporium funariophilum]|nr:hypothetical protein B0H34DRAFT_842015 [Crassisporium funariophilum]
MMLVQVPSMDAVNGLSIVDSLPSFSSFADSFSIFSHLSKPSLFLTILASLVILSSIRAALLFMRPLSSQQKGTVSLVQSGVEKSDAAIPSTSASTSASTGEKGKQTVIISAKTTMEVSQKKTTSWCWGLLKWDSLPALPTMGGRMNGRSHNRSGAMCMSETERGWQPQQQGRRSGPAFDHPLPTLYQSEVPVSMAKMIMSRHTFRRPTSRPPPVRATNAPQYQRRTPSMV